MLEGDAVFFGIRPARHRSGRVQFESAVIHQNTRQRSGNGFGHGPPRQEGFPGDAEGIALGNQLTLVGHYHGSRQYGCSGRFAEGYVKGVLQAFNINTRHPAERVAGTIGPGFIGWQGGWRQGGKGQGVDCVHGLINQQRTALAGPVHGSGTAGAFAKDDVLHLHCFTLGINGQVPYPGQGLHLGRNEGITHQVFVQATGKNKGAKMFG